MVAAAVTLLVLLRVARRRTHPSRRIALLPSPVANTVAPTVFGLAGAWSLGMGLDAIVVAVGDGSGQLLSAAPVALVAAACFGTRLIRELREPSPS